MQPHVLTIRKHNVTRWLAKLLESRDVIAPASGPCGEIVFSEVHSPEQVLWDFENPLPPPKQFVLPQTDPIIRIQRDSHRTEVAPIYDGRQRILFNVRPCDAKGIAFLTHVHEMEPADASYLRRAGNLTVISLACSAPCRLGFCVCSDSGPFLNTGHDIQLTDLGEKYLAEIASAKGEGAVSDAASLFDPPTEDDVVRRMKLEAEARGRFGEETCHFASAMRRVSTRRVHDALWERMSDWCLECGACNFICPTCYCFSVKDRRSDGMWTRCRTWDSCQYAAFTLEASGHNPRAQHGERIRRRSSFGAGGGDPCHGLAEPPLHRRPRRLTAEPEQVRPAAAIRATEARHWDRGSRHLRHRRRPPVLDVVGAPPDGAGPGDAAQVVDVPARPLGRMSSRAMIVLVIGSSQLVFGVLGGVVLIVFGLVPGLLQRFADAVSRGIQEFIEHVRHGSSFSFGFARPARPDERSRPTWLAGLGAALIAVTVLAFLST